MQLLVLTLSFSSLTSGWNQGCVGKGFGQDPISQRIWDGGGKAASPRAAAGFVERRSEETKHEGPGCKLLYLFLSHYLLWWEGSAQYVSGEWINGDRQVSALGFAAQSILIPPVFLQSQDEVLPRAWNIALYLPFLSMLALCGPQGSAPGGSCTPRVVLGPRRKGWNPRGWAKDCWILGWKGSHHLGEVYRM